MDGAVIRTAYLACLDREKVFPSINERSIMPSNDCKSDNHHRDGSRDKAFCSFPVLLVPGICSLFKSCCSISYCLCGTGHQFRRIYPVIGDEDAADEEDDHWQNIKCNTRCNNAITWAPLSSRNLKF